MHSNGKPVGPAQGWVIQVLSWMLQLLAFLVGVTGIVFFCKLIVKIVTW